MKAMRSLDKERGVTLIELLVSIVIGLVVVAAVLVSFVGSGRAGRYQAALGQMNQDAQIGLNLLSREVQMAGYVSPGNILPAPPLFGCDAASGTEPFISPTGSGDMTCNATGASTVSALEVVYEADLRNTVPTSAPAPSDCLGNTAPVIGAISVARNRYYIKPSSSGRNELHCASNAGNTPQPLIENVEDMQLWFGVAASTAPETVIRYARAGKDISTPGTINAQTAGEWNNVNSVRICLLMRSPEPILTGEDPTGYMDCNSNPQTSADGILRRAYFTTAMVRTKMLVY
jgi:type IV pilus assembly protein PilW